MKILKKCLPLFLALFMILSFCACGAESQKTSDTEEKEAELWNGQGAFYKTQPAELPEQSYSHLAFSGEIYSVCSEGETMEHPERKEVLYRGAEPIFSAADLGKPAAGKDGIWLIAEDTEGNCSLKLFTQEGMEIKSFGTDANTFDELFVSDTAIFILRGGSELRALDFDCNELWRTKLKGDNSYIVKSADNKLYFVLPNEKENELQLINSENGSLEAAFSCLPGNVSSGCGEDFLYLNNDSGMYTLNSDGETEAFIIWSECGLPPCGTGTTKGLLRGVIPVNPQCFLIQDMGGVKLLTAADPAKLKAKQELKLVTANPDYYLELFTAQFNNENQDYYISLIDYSQGGTVECNVAQTRLNTEIISGEVPDMINFNPVYLSTGRESSTELHPFSPGPFISQGLLLDLNEFFRNDDEISLDDLSIKNALCVDGELFVIGSSFNFSTLAGKESDFGDRTGWKFDEYIEMGENLPTENVLTNFNVDSFSKYILYPNILKSIDWENGNCTLDEEAFASLLDAGKNLIQESGSAESYLYPVYGVDVYSLAEAEAVQGEALSFPGWPTLDGSCGSFYELSCSVGIMKNTKNPEGCWEFIKYILKNSANNGLPVYKPELLRLAKECEDSGSIYTDTGERLVFTSADTENLLNFLTKLQNWGYKDDNIISIINSECEAFFNGNRSSIETAQSINSKLSIYIAERLG